MEWEAAPPRPVYCLWDGAVGEWAGREHPSGVWYLRRHDPARGLIVTVVGALDVWFSPVVAAVAGRDLAEVER